jgi:hypothetical protein
MAELTRRVINLERALLSRTNLSNNQQPDTSLLGSSSTGLTAYMFAVGDANQAKLFTASTAVTATVPKDAFPVGTVIEAQQDGAGQVTFVGATGVTIDSEGSKVKTAGQAAVCHLWQESPNHWRLSGNRA